MKIHSKIQTRFSILPVNEPWLISVNKMNLFFKLVMRHMKVKTIKNPVREIW